jgi:hypothetical protein
MINFDLASRIHGFIFVMEKLVLFLLLFKLDQFEA